MILKSEMTARIRAESQLAAERRRVAADLHDTLEQTLVAASLQLSAAARMQPHENGNLVVLAQQLLSRGQKEVRDAVWDLRMDQSQPQLLSTLLAQTCAEAASLSALDISFSFIGMEQATPALIASQSVRLVREAGGSVPGLTSF